MVQKTMKWTPVRRSKLPRYFYRELNRRLLGPVGRADNYTIPLDNPSLPRACLENKKRCFGQIERIFLEFKSGQVQVTLRKTSKRRAPRGGYTSQYQLVFFRI